MASFRKDPLESERGSRPGKGNPDEDEFRLNIEPIRVSARSDDLEGDGDEGRDGGVEPGGVAAGGVPGGPGVEGTTGAAAEAMIGKV